MSEKRWSPSGTKIDVTTQLSRYQLLSRNLALIEDQKYLNTEIQKAVQNLLEIYPSVIDEGML